jgi:ribosomal protein L16
MIVNNKFLKKHKIKVNSCENKSTILLNGVVGLKVLDKCCLELSQYNAIKFFFRRFFKKTRGTIWYRVFPKFYVTKKSLGNARMGKGKGSLDRLIIYVKKAQILFELNIKTKEDLRLAYKLLKQCAFKLPVKSKIFFTKK